jgi:shikimate dehydrogenase
MTQKVGVIGWPIEHSLSPVMHNAAFEALGMDWHYDAIAIPPDIVRYGIREPQRHGYVGINITVPYKEVALEFARPDEIAREVGAVNTIDFRTNTGTNTDVTGLTQDLRAHEIELNNARVIVLGAGGATRSAIYALVREGAQVVVVNRTIQKAHVMLADLKMSAGITSVDVQILDQAARRETDLIINCTAAGLWPETDISPWIESVPFPHGAVVYDMVYRPEKTKLMQQAEAAGCRVVTGLGMLVRQGAASFHLWTGVEPPLEVMFAAAWSKLRSGAERAT